MSCVGTDLSTSPAAGPLASDPLDESSSAEMSKSCDGALAQAFKFLGKRWNGVILGTLTNGSSGFAELKRNVQGISDSVLSERLSELQQAGLITRSVVPGPPLSVSYELSDTGNALIPAMHALSTWASENFPRDTDHYSSEESS
jgi:DNA-binding HxlR family transcriptional regulator